MRMKHQSVNKLSPPTLSCNDLFSFIYQTEQQMEAEQTKISKRNNQGLHSNVCSNPNQSKAQPPYIIKINKA